MKKSYFFVFPGQGSQHTGMGKFLYDNFSQAKEVFQEASDAISFDLKKLCFDGAESDLALTENTQPAIVTVSVATYRVLESEFALSASLSAGHSVGEYSAAISQNVIALADGIRAVRLRGQAMQSAVPVGVGGMLACIGLNDAQALELCAWAQKETGLTPLEPANYNSPGQIVLSGRADIIDHLLTHFKPELIAGFPAKVRLLPLKVSAPFHCSMMKPAEAKMRDFLSGLKFKDAEHPIVQNYTAEMVTEASLFRQNLISQICGSVLWTKSMEKALCVGAHETIECGAGKVLSGLLKKIDAEKFKVHTTTSLEDFKAFQI